MALLWSLIGTPVAYAGLISGTKVVLGSAIAGSVTSATISFTPATAIPSGGKVVVIFPAGSSPYTITAPTVTGAGFNPGATLAVETVNQTTVTIGITGGTGSPVVIGAASGAALSITVSGITLPPNATSTVGILNGLQTEHLGSTLDTISGGLTFPQLSAGTLTAMSASLTTTIKASTGSLTIGMTLANPLPAGGTIAVTLPTGYSASGGSQVTPNGFTVASASVSGQVVTVTNGSNPVAKATQLLLTISEITNPPSASSGATFLVVTRTATVNGVVPNDIDTAQVVGPVIINASVTNPTITLTSTQAGATTSATIAFTVDDAWVATGRLRITMPTGFGYSSPSATISGANGTLATPTVTGQAVVLVRSGGGTVTAAGTRVTVVLSGVVNPTTTGTVTYPTGTLQTLDASGTLLGSSGPFTTAQSITSGILTAGNAGASPTTAGSTSTIKLAFTVTNGIPSNGTIRLDFPSSSTAPTSTNFYVVTNATFNALSYYTPTTTCSTTLPGTETPVGATGTPTSTNGVFTITLNNNATIPNGACVVASIANIRLPQVSGRTASVLITTRTATNVQIDAGSVPVSTMVQPGTLGTSGVTPITFTTVTTTPDNGAGKSIKVTATFDLSSVNPLPAGATVRIAFPTAPSTFGFTGLAVDTVTTTPTIPVLGPTETNAALFTLITTYTAPNIDLTYAGTQALAPGTRIAITLRGISTPPVSTTTLANPTGQATTWVITTGLDKLLTLPIDTATITNGPVIVPGNLGGPGVTPSGIPSGTGSPTVAFATGEAGRQETAVVRVKLSNPLATGDRLRVTFPDDGFVVTNTAVTGTAAIVSTTNGATSTGIFSAGTPSATQVLVTYGGGATFDSGTTAILPTGATIALQLEGIRVPTTIPAAGATTYGTTGTKGVTGVVTVQTEAASGYLLDQGTTDTGVEVVPARVSFPTGSSGLAIAPAVTSTVASFTSTFIVGKGATVPACVAPVVGLTVGGLGGVSTRSSTCGIVTITLPTTVTMPSTLPPTSSITISVDGSAPASAIAVAQTGTALRFATPVALPTGATVVVTIDTGAGITTPAVGGSYTATVATSSAPTEATSGASVVGAAAPDVNISTVSPSTVGQPLGGMVINFTTGSGAPLTAGLSTITLTFPPAFTMPTTIGAGYLWVNNTGLSTAIAATPITGGGQRLTFVSPVNVNALASVALSFWQNANILVPTNAGPHIIKVQTSSAPVDTAGTVRFAPATAERLQILFPGETSTPGVSPGKSGAPTLATGVPAVVKIRAIDKYFNLVSTGSGTSVPISLAYTDPATVLPATFQGQTATRALIGGEGTITITPTTVGSFILSAVDAETSPTLLSASQTVAVSQGPLARFVVLAPGETLAPGTATGISGTADLTTPAGTTLPTILTIVGTDGAFNLTTVTNGYQVTVRLGAATSQTITLTAGTGSITLALPIGVSVIAVTSVTDPTITSTRSVTVGTYTAPAPVDAAPAAPATPAPASTVVPTTAPVATPTPNPTVAVPASATPQVTAPTTTPQAAPTATITPETAEPTPVVDLPMTDPNGKLGPVETPSPDAPAVTSPTAPVVPTPTAVTDPGAPLPERSRAPSTVTFVPEIEFVAKGARIGFAPGTGTALPAGTKAEAVVVRTDVAFALPGVPKPPAGTTPITVYQTIARDAEGGFTPFQAVHLITVNIAPDTITTASGAKVGAESVYAFEIRDGRWDTVPTSVDERTGTLIARATNDLVAFIAFDPSTIRPEADYTIGATDNGAPTTRFFTQTNGRTPGTVPLGYGVTDQADGPRFREAFDRAGGIDALGYPISRQTAFKGFQVQVTQKTVLQWVGNGTPDTGVAARLNVLDELTALGFDDYLRTALRIPKTFSNEGDEGLSMDGVIARHVGFLDVNPRARDIYLETPNYLRELGLPTAFEEFDDAFVIRTQRAVITVWKVAQPGIPAGEATVVAAGELLKTASLLSTTAGLVAPISVDAFAPALPPGAEVLPN